MATETAISWTDSTFNPWWGCMKIAPGCDNCYATAFDHRIGGEHFGPNATYRIMKDDNWKNPLKWNKKAIKLGKRHKVFSGSMCDVFDNRAPEGLRERLFKLIKATPMLDWQLLTKRPQNIERFLPSDWGNGYDNVWLGVTVENRQHGLPRVDILRKIPAKVRFLSVEPLIEDLGEFDLTGINWVIVGGESGQRIREMKEEWVYPIQEKCARYGAAFFFKQKGGRDEHKGGCSLGGQEYKAFPRV